MKFSEKFKIALFVIAIWSTLLGICWYADSCSPTPCQTTQDDAPMDPDEDAEVNPLVGFKIVQFTAVWCGPCKQQSPIIDRMAAEGYPVLRCDVDNPNGQRQLAAKFQVTRIPTIIFFLDGKVVERYTGVQSYETLTKKAKELRPAPKPDKPKPNPVKPTDNDDSGLDVDKGRFPYKFQSTRPPTCPNPNFSQSQSTPSSIRSQPLSSTFSKSSTAPRSPHPRLAPSVKLK